MLDSHMHTVLCQHATGTADQYAAAAYNRGLSGIIFTCHNPLPHGLSRGLRMKPEQFEHYLALVDQARRKWRGRLDVRLGLECDYLPEHGLEPWLEQQAKAAEYDYLLVSIHPHLPEYRNRFWRDDPIAFQHLYFEHLAESAELGLHDALAHPDLVKNLTAETWCVDHLLDSIRRCLDRVAATGLAMELNTSGWNKQVREQNPGFTILCEIAARQIPVVLGSDAHEPERVGDRFLEAISLLKQAGFDRLSYFQNRRRQDMPIDQVGAGLSSLAREPSLATRFYP